MQISGLGGFPLWLPGGPVAAPAAPAPAAPGFAQLVPALQSQQQSIAALALLQSEEHGGGGGHGKKQNLKAIEDLAARASLQIEPRQKTPAERQAEIERLKAMQLAAAMQVGEKQRDGDGGQGRRQQQPGQDQEQPANS